jgi:hypothetical protein
MYRPGKPRPVPAHRKHWTSHPARAPKFSPLIAKANFAFSSFASQILAANAKDEQ